MSCMVKGCQKVEQSNIKPKAEEKKRRETDHGNSQLYTTLN